MAAKAIEVVGPIERGFEEVLSTTALGFVASLHREFNSTRETLLEKRAERQLELDSGRLPDFLPSTRLVREGTWKVVAAPQDLQDRRLEITGPTERKMMINALNSGAKVFMADFEDSLTPTWSNIIAGQVNLADAIEHTIEFQSPDGKVYKLNDKIATLIVRPRGWHLTEKHVLVDGQPASASLVDFGLYFFHNARRLLTRGSGPYLYLPKLESHLEARLWNDVFNFAQDTLRIARGTIRATVLIETILAAFEMEEILYELRDHSGGLNAGRWDYLFSIIKKFRNRSEFVLVDRNSLDMTVPFMRAYSELLVKTCHRRGAHAIGGMAAYIPNRKHHEMNSVAMAKVREDKERESKAGFDGSWVAHPDLVPLATEVFDRQLRERANQLERTREDVNVTAQQLLDVRVSEGRISEAGLCNDVSVAIQYLESWLRGAGAVAIFGLMEDTATAEIARSQVWQWIRNGVHLAEGPQVTRTLLREVERNELAKMKSAIGAQAFNEGKFKQAQELFERIALKKDYCEFLTVPAYHLLD